MTKYLETKKNSIEEAISSVVLGENGFVVGKVKMPKMKGGAKLQSKTNFDFRLFDPEDSPGSDKANDEQKKKSQILYDKIMAKAKEVGIADEVGKYMKMHLDSMLKGDPKLGFGRTDVKESYQEMISRIMSRRSMR